MDETHVKVAGHWRVVCRAIDQFGRVIDVFVVPGKAPKRLCRFFTRATGTNASAPARGPQPLPQSLDTM